MSLSASDLSVAPYEYWMNPTFVNTAHKDCQKFASTYFLGSSLTTLSLKDCLFLPHQNSCYFPRRNVLYCFSSLEHAAPSAWNPHLSCPPANSYQYFKISFPAISFAILHQQVSLVLSMSWHLPVLWFQVTLFMGTVDFCPIQPLLNSLRASKKNVSYSSLNPWCLVGAQ